MKDITAFGLLQTFTMAPRTDDEVNRAAKTFAKPAFSQVAFRFVWGLFGMINANESKWLLLVDVVGFYCLHIMKIFNVSESLEEIGTIFLAKMRKKFAVSQNAFFWVLSS